MPKPIIEVKELSKVYKISHVRKPYHTLREDLIEAAKTPIRFLHGHRSDKEEFWALKDVNFDVKRGEILGIIGKNGAGKSTLLKVLSRITDPTSGRAVLRGRVASLLEVGTGFHPELTGRENIYLNGALLGMSRQEIARKFDEIVAFSEIEKFLDTPVKFYSSGMYVRLAFAVAAHLEPEILIVDEVLAVGDADFQKKSLDRMHKVARRGRTVIFVSHNMGAIANLCNQVILLEKGKLIGKFSTTEGISRYLTSSGLGHPVKSSERIKVEAGSLVFNHFTINGLPAESTIVIPSGEPITIMMQYRSSGRPKDLLVGIALKHRLTGSFPVYTHNQLEGVRHLTGKAGQVQVKLHLPRLAPGVYAFELHVWVDGEMLVEDHEVCQFRILETPAFKSQQLLSTFPSSVLIDSEWSFDKTL